MPRKTKTTEVAAINPVIEDTTMTNEVEVEVEDTLDNGITLPGQLLENLKDTTTHVGRVLAALEALEPAQSGAFSPAKNLAASLSWSMAGGISTMMTAIATLDSPDNPRRPRSVEAAAEETSRLERMIEERVHLLSILSRMTSPELLPVPEQMIDPDGNSSVPQTLATPEEIAEMFNMPISQVKANLKGEADRFRKLNQLRDRVLLKNDNLRANIVSTLHRAMEGYSEMDGDLDPRFAGRLYEKMADKLDQSMNRNSMIAARTSRVRRRLELAGQNRVMQPVIDQLDRWIEDVEQEVEQNQFEIHHAVARKHDERRLAEEITD
jgi:hypothetical protein